MMSTTGRMPVIAAPTPIPVMPTSEIGESMIRCGPNSSTNPESTLNGVPASATSSPITYTVASRRSSSASASRIACASVNSRTPADFDWLSIVLGVDILINLAGIWERRVEREIHRRLDLGARFPRHPVKRIGVDNASLFQPLAEQSDWVALGLPVLLLLLRAVVGALDIANVVAIVAIGVAEEE